MNGKRHRTFLLKVANKVDELLTQNITTKTRFREQIESAFRQNELFYQALEKYRQDAEKNPRLKDREAGSPYEGWVWDEFQPGESRLYLRFQPDEGHWRPPDKDLPENPLGWYFGFLIGISTPKFLESFFDEEKSVLEYFLLAVIHDWALIDSGGSTSDLIYFEHPSKNYSKHNQLAQDCWELLNDFPLNQEYTMGDQVRANIKCALEHVQADLAAAETEQKQNLGKKSRVKRGRHKKYTSAMAKQMHDMYEQRYEKNNDSKGSWGEVAKFFGIKSGKAAEMACRRYLHKQNK